MTEIITIVRSYTQRDAAASPQDAILDPEFEDDSVVGRQPVEASALAQLDIFAGRPAHFTETAEEPVPSDRRPPIRGRSRILDRRRCLIDY